MEQNKRTQIAELGEFGLIDKLTGAFAPRNRTTLRGVGDDAVEFGKLFYRNSVSHR